MSDLRPVAFVWCKVECPHCGAESNDLYMRPIPRMRRLADDQYVAGEEYPLDLLHNASDRSRRHYFASVKNAWDNLPDEIALQYPTPEHLRKKALVACGYATHRVLVLASPKEARKAGTEMRQIDPYAVLEISGNVLNIWQARSQQQSKMKGGMSAAEFKESKKAVLDWCAGLIGTTRDTLERQPDNGRGRDR